MYVCECVCVHVHVHVHVCVCVCVCVCSKYINSTNALPFDNTLIGHDSSRRCCSLMRRKTWRRPWDTQESCAPSPLTNHSTDACWQSVSTTRVMCKQQQKPSDFSSTCRTRPRSTTSMCCSTLRAACTTWVILTARTPTSTTCSRKSLLTLTLSWV